MFMTSRLRLTTSGLSRRIKTCLFGMLVLMASAWPSAKVNAGFLSTVEINLGILNVFPGVNEQLSNSVNTTPLTLEDQIRSGTHLASGFASIEPFPEGEETIIHFRAEAIARQDTSAVGFGGTSQATATATWRDHIYASWLPEEPRAEFVWGAVLHLNGTLSVRTAASFGYQASAAVDFSAVLGSAAGSHSFQKNVAGGNATDFQSFDDRTIAVRTPSEDVFSPEGVDFLSSLHVSALASSLGGGGIALADSSFGHTGRFLGFVALDSEGNILQGIGDKVRIESDSGLEYRILDAVPVDAVPEPAGFLLLGTGIFALLTLKSRRLPKG